MIRPATTARQCSLVELVAAGAQPPKWFVSHWWGEPVAEFLKCVAAHARDHTPHAADPDEGTLYWVCAYANNQHKLGDDVTEDPADSSFVKAIALAEGRVLSVLDADCVTYSRIWCCLELFIGLRGTYEVYTTKDGCEAYDTSEAAQEVAVRAVLVAATEAGVAPNFANIWPRLPLVTRDAVGITSGAVEGDWFDSAAKTRRESAFPLERVRRAFEIKVSGAEASMEADRRRILNHIAERPLDAEPLPDSPHYSRTDDALHGCFAAAAWRLLLERDERMEEYGSVLRLSRARTFAGAFGGCTQATDAALRLLADSLPSELETLSLSLGEAASADAAVAIGGELQRLPSLRKLTLREGCIGAAGLAAVVAGLQASGAWGRLEELKLLDAQLAGEIPAALGGCVALQRLELGRNQLTGEIPAALGQCVALQRLDLGRNQLTGEIPAALGQCVALETLKLSGNRLTGEIPAALGQCVALQSLSLVSNQLTGVVPAALGQCSALQELDVRGNPLTGYPPALAHLFAE